MDSCVQHKNIPCTKHTVCELSVTQRVVDKNVSRGCRNTMLIMLLVQHYTDPHMDAATPLASSLYSYIHVHFAKALHACMAATREHVCVYVCVRRHAACRKFAAASLLTSASSHR